MTVLTAGNIDIPTNLFPFSTQTSSGGSSYRNQSGINWKSPFMKQLMPELTKGVQGLQGALTKSGQMGGVLNDMYSNLMRRGMGANAFQGTLNSLSGRGMLGSSIASDSLASAGKGIAQMIADKAYESRANQLQSEISTQLSIPQILAQLAGLGQESTGSGSSSQSSSSYSANPLAAYELKARYDLAGL